ncbi:acetylcholinesterase-like isoform X2 [Symsagittifera roscoffensis]|uniref:acetylcholinesterase-like isoform X2 n=1 Tax=Symsagittifera roscoffensis TaxID=84072 RepID=UPI00307B99ED
MAVLFTLCYVAVVLGSCFAYDSTFFGGGFFPYIERQFFQSTRFLPLIHTKFGPIQGRQDYDPNNKMDQEFYGGIPYAKTPVGIKRFERPERWTEKYAGVLDGINFKPPCPQFSWSPLTASFEGRDQYNQSRVPTSSDCLYLNIWRPAFPSRGDNPNNHYLSVLVVIYEEDFYMNRPEDPLMSGSGQSWSNDLLVVTVAFRSGLLGYFNGSNVALYDVKMALEWVHENIHSFRGNQSKITVVGAGTGATLVSLLAINQRTWHKKLISNIVLMSGKGLFSPGSFQAPSEIKFYSNVSAQIYGCLDQPDPANPQLDSINMTCMGALTEEQMLNMSLEGGAGQYPSVKGWYRYYSRYPWTPVIDGDIVRPEVTNFLQFNNYDEQQLRSMFFEFQVLGINVIAGVNSNAGVNGLAFTGMVDIDADSYHTPYDFKKYTAGLNSDLGQCGLSAILFQYTDWTEPPDPDRSRRDSLIRMCTDRFKRCPMVNFANFMMKQPKYAIKEEGGEDFGRVWIYQWDHPYGKIFPEWMGAIETSDLVYMMTHPMNTKRNPSFTSEEAKLSLAFSSYIGNFAWYGDPNYVKNGFWDGRAEKKTPFWEEATLDNGKKFLNFRVNQLETRENLAAKDCAFWRKLVPTLHEEFQQVIDESGILNLPTMGIFNFGRDFNGPKNQSYVRCKQEFKFQ